MTALSFGGYSGARRSTTTSKGRVLTVSAASDQVTTAVGSPELSERDREILAFERQWWKYAGSKETAIKELFDMSSTRYYQVLNALIDNPVALAHDPMLVKRLRRLRASRQRARSARRLGMEP
ncbi:DUF3263 domain-containing protein [Phycicoccus sp. CSK15P-2]|nr:DUF3263 domain-containing protein [Phycicoccus sp. CSK15P-2]